MRLYSPVAWVILVAASIGVGIGVILACYQAPWPAMRIVGWILGSVALTVPVWVGIATLRRRRG
jgi:hypothetical protein